MNKKLLLLPSVISFIVSGTATAGGFAMSVGMTIIDTDVTVKNAQYQAPGANINANFDKESIFHFDGFAGFPGIDQDCKGQLCKRKAWIRN